MRLTTLFYTVILISSGAFAQADNDPLLEGIRASYRAAGIDNNYIDAASYSREEWLPLMARYEGKVLISQSQKLVGLRYCVFMNQGAYGNHISPETAWELADRWTQHVEQDPSIQAIYLLTGESIMAWEIISASCALGIERADGQVLLIQAKSVD